MAISIAAATLPTLSSTSGSRRINSSFSTSSSSSLSSSSCSLFLNDTKRLGLGLLFKAQTNVKYNRRKKSLSCNCLFGLGVPELVVIAGVAALVFGPKQLPEVGRSFGKTIKSFQQAAKEFESELRKEPDAVTETSTEKAVAVTKEEMQEVTVASTNEN